MSDFLANTSIIRNPHLLATEIDGEIILLHIETGHYYGLATTARRIWELLEVPHTVTELCEQLTKEFDIGATDVQTQVDAFLQTLQAEGIISAESPAGLPGNPYIKAGS